MNKALNHTAETAIIEVTEAELAEVVGGDLESDRALNEFLERYRRDVEQMQP